jgi:spore coat protein U-like protein
VKLAALALAVTASLTLTQAAHALSCSLSTAGVAFGAYDFMSGTALDSTGSVTYHCDGVGASDTIVVQLDRGGSSSYLPRTLSQGAYQLEYNLYLDAPRTRIWGDASAGTEQLGPLAPPNGVSTEVRIYGRIRARQNAHTGTYSDTVTVTVVF